MFMPSKSVVNRSSIFFLNHFTMPCMFPGILPKVWLTIFYLCGCSSSTDCCMYPTLLSPAKGDIYCPTEDHSGKHGWLCCMICISENRHRHKASTMRHNA